MYNNNKLNRMKFDPRAYFSSEMLRAINEADNARLKKLFAKDDNGLHKKNAAQV